MAKPVPPKCKAKCKAKAKVAATISDDNREALEELLRQVSGLAATTVGAQAGGSVNFQLTRAEAPWAGTADYAVITAKSRREPMP